ncbi:MAG TPA: asparagine--tRNA ligase [Chitinophagales bacterium]|nr:asparagine--tRNA ligase [Chitinophagales bacterium]HRK25649.1 asparagine--tRNA ligase [Chitinophagales bacterium]
MIYVQNIAQHEGQTVTLKGWVESKRTGGKVAFITLRDGSGFIECIFSLDAVGEESLETAKRATQESSIEITGTVVKNEKQEFGYELHATGIQIYQLAAEYPISRKEHGVDFLMNNRHLWLRSRRQWAILRVRNRLKFAIHQFFQNNGFTQTDAPLLTGNACEGTTTLFETEYYEKNIAYLSQSGQLYAEAIAMAMGKVYTFGPTFRAERSSTPRHLSEFWMIEPEMAFYNLEMDMELIEAFVKFIVNAVYADCKTELTILERDTTLFDNINKPFPRITYSDAVKIIQGKMDYNGRNAIETLRTQLAKVTEELQAKNTEIAETEALLAKGGVSKGQVNYYQSKIDRLKVETRKLEDKSKEIPEWIEASLSFPDGEDFGSPQEKALTSLFNTPVMVYKWPRAIKAFYMKRYEDDPEFVKGVDLLAPEGFGEIVGGSERETDLQTLIDAINHHNLPMEAFEWYLDLRRFGSVPHAGFGLGFERVVMWLTGVSHIRETIPFPRYYGRLFP